MKFWSCTEFWILSEWLAFQADSVHCSSYQYHCQWWRLNPAYFARWDTAWNSSCLFCLTRVCFLWKHHHWQCWHSSLNLSSALRGLSNHKSLSGKCLHLCVTGPNVLIQHKAYFFENLNWCIVKYTSMCLYKHYTQ